MHSHTPLSLKEKGWSTIFFAADNKDLPIAQLLCESGASITLLDKVWLCA